jgi:orotate phosphoribosyltransferase
MKTTNKIQQNLINLIYAQIVTLREHIVIKPGIQHDIYCNIKPNANTGHLNSYD